MLLGTDRKIFEQDSVVQARIRNLAKAFPDDAFDAIVFSTRAHGAPASCPLAPNAHAYAANARTRLGYGSAALRVAKTLPRPDIVSAADPFETGLAALMIARHFRAPLAVEMHTDFTTRAYARVGLVNRVRLAIARFVLPRAAGGYAVSKRVRDAVVRRYGLTRPFSVLPIFVDTARFEALPRTPQAGNLLWVGRFTKEKDPASALRALAALGRAGHDARLTLLGEGPLASALRALAEALHISAQVSFPGWQDPAAYLPGTELLLSTSRYEGYGMAIVEALSAGVPVLATDTGIARDAGAVIAQGPFAEALIAWFEGPRARGTLRLPAYESESAYFARVRALYASLASTRATVPGTDGTL